MRFLATADLQAEWSNLDLCTRSWKESVKICVKNQLQYLVFCGDGKEVYDPVSIRVIQWWEWAIEYASLRHIQVIYIRGNHDRIATFDVAGSWLSIMKNAGAITFDQPGVYDTGDGRFFMLPYAKVKTLKKWAHRLLKHKPNKKKDCLFFHANLLEARYSQHGMESNSALSVDDLFPSHFRFCIGGDIHLPQKIGKNIYYTGSSFCHDWGEVNQRKRYLVVRDSDILSIHSQIPRWFDTSVPGFHRAIPHKGFDGARIKIRVQCDPEEDYRRKLEKATRKAKKKYKGAELFVVPEFTESRAVELAITQHDSDERKLSKYMEEATPRVSQSRCLSYMLKVLSHFAGGLRGKSNVEFLEAHGKNILSFKELQVDFRKKGITVIKGENLDRQGKSNGSGKTGYMQAVPVALFGQTFKKQKHDHWSNRWKPKEKAFISTLVRDERGNKIEVIRGRRPTMLKLLVNGHNESTGMKSTDRLATQAQIESKIGFTWDTLANAVYMDRSVAHAFLSGTNKQRTDVLSRFQNLERFEKALKLVKKDVRKNDDTYHEVKSKLERVEGSIEECIESLDKLKKLQKVQLKAAYKEYKKHKKQLDKFVRSHKNKEVLKTKLHKLEDLSKLAYEAVQLYRSKLAVVSENSRRYTSRLNHWMKLVKKGICPTCFRSMTSSQIKENKKKLAENCNKALERQSRTNTKLKYALKTATMLEDSVDNIRTQLDYIRREESDLRILAEHAKDVYQDLKKHQKSSAIIASTKSKIKSLRAKRHDYKHQIEKLLKRRLMYEYVMHAFSRDGIPAFLNRQLCPALNRAAEEYSELFSDKEIQVRFKIEEGEFIPEVINAKGGAGIGDQSTGELTMAAIIASFAASEVAPKTNLLMLDEPAEGLDEVAARQFAKGLIKLKDRFKTIFICTHNRAIESTLSAEHTVLIQKKGGISRVQ